MRTLPPKRGGRSNYSVFSVMNPGKGLNNLISDNIINNQEASDLENIEFTESGVPQKAPGYTEVGTGLSNAPRGIGNYVDTSMNRYLLTVDGTGLKYLNGTTWTSIAGATFSSSAQINFTQARGKMYIWDGTSGGAELSGLTLSRPGTMPKAKFSIFYGGFHIASGVDSQENRLYISTATDASDFTNDPSVTDPTPDNSTDVPGATVFTGTGTGSAIAQFIDVNRNDGDKITGLAKFGEALMIFKERSIFQLTFDSTGVPIVQAVTKSYGCVSHRSIDNVDNDVFFLTRNGIYVLGYEPNFTNIIRTNELSARIHGIIDTINPLYYANSSALFNQYVYYLGVPTAGSTTNNTTLTYDRRYLAFSKWTHIIFESIGLYINTSNQEEIYFTSTTTAKVFKITPGTFTANGSPISASWTSKAFDLDKFDEFKRWIDMTLLFRQLSGVVTIEIIADGNVVTKESSISALSDSGMGSYMWGEGMFGETPVSSDSSTASSTNNVPYRIRIGKKSRTMKIRISNARNNENFMLLGLAIAYRRYSHFVFDSSLKVS